jgi:hypothetical protein
VVFDPLDGVVPAVFDAVEHAAEQAGFVGGDVAGLVQVVADGVCGAGVAGVQLFGPVACALQGVAGVGERLLLLLVVGGGVRVGGRAGCGVGDAVAGRRGGQCGPGAVHGALLGGGLLLQRVGLALEAAQLVGPPRQRVGRAAEGVLSLLDQRRDIGVDVRDERLRRLALPVAALDTSQLVDRRRQLAVQIPELPGQGAGAVDITGRGVETEVRETPGDGRHFLPPVFRELASCRSASSKVFPIWSIMWTAVSAC